MGFGGYYSGAPPVPPETPPADPMTVPLPTEQPATWIGREDRVRWVLHHFTRGEKSKLKRMLDDELRHYDLRALERKERDELLAAQQKTVRRWP